MTTPATASQNATRSKVLNDTKTVIRDSVLLFL